MIGRPLPRRAIVGLAGGLALPALTPARAALSGATLVIGNGGYQWEAPLANPRRDARLMGQMLEALGLEGEVLIDADRAAMQAALGRFARRADGAAVAVLFFAGHGIQRQSSNFLVPVDADLQAGADAPGRLLPVNQAIRAMARARQRVLILDACRNDPLAGAGEIGLARIDDGTPGSLFCFATSPGRVALDGAGQNSPFTDALLDHLGTPGLELRQVLTRVRRRVLIATDSRQVPWDNSSLTEDLVLRDGGLPPVPRPMLAPVAPPQRPAPPPAPPPSPAPARETPASPARPPARETPQAAAPSAVRSAGAVAFDPQRYREIPRTYAMAREQRIPLPGGLLVQVRDADRRDTPLAGSYIGDTEGILIVLGYDVGSGRATFLRARNSAMTANRTPGWFQRDGILEDGVLTWTVQGTVLANWNLNTGWMTALDRRFRNGMLAPPATFRMPRFE